MFAELGYWYSIKDGDMRGRDMLNRHYSGYHYKDERKPRLFVGPGEKMVLMTADSLALFVWRKFQSDNNQHGVNCAVFRNEAPPGTYVASVLIEEACQLAWLRWPNERLYTYVNPHNIQSTNPGYCFKVAGFTQCGITKVNKLLIFERLAT